MVSSATKSFILATAVVIINFLAYITFRFQFFGELNIGESLVFTVWISVIDFVLVFGISWLLFNIK